MNLKLVRYSDNKESTLGILFLDDEFLCYTLEDTHRKEKIAGQTRIPEGKYKIGSCVYAKSDINEPLIIKRFAKNMYYCKLADNSDPEELLYSESELLSVQEKKDSQ